MKKYYLAIAFLAIIIGCAKDDVINISGKVVNVKDSKPVSGLTMTVGFLEFIDVWWDSKILTSDITNSKGEFELSFEKDKNILSFNYHLNIESLGSEFQPGARINGRYYKMLCSDEGFDDLEDNGYYQIELIPVTKAYFLKPNVPTGWETDTLILKIENLVLSPYFIGDDCKFDTTTFTLRLDDINGWGDIQTVRNLHLGNELTVHYTIKNGTTKKSGTFTKACLIGDTTAVELPIW